MAPPSCATSRGGGTGPALGHSRLQRLGQNLPPLRPHRLPPAQRRRVAVLGQHYGESDWRELRLQVGLVSSSIRQLMADAEPALTTVISGKYAMIDYWGRVRRETRRRPRASWNRSRPATSRSAAGRSSRRASASACSSAARSWLARACSFSMSRRRSRSRCPRAFPRLSPAARRARRRPRADARHPSLEEIVPAFTHALLLREGAVVAREPTADSSPAPDSQSSARRAALQSSPAGNLLRLGAERFTSSYAHRSRSPPLVSSRRDRPRGASTGFPR